MRRVHRTLRERVGYMAIYQCKSCQEVEVVPRGWRYHLGPVARCPQCGTRRLNKLKGPDRIDPMFHGLLNLAERLAHGKLYNCCFCRIQFYDRRPLPLTEEAVAVDPAAEGSVESPESAV